VHHQLRHERRVPVAISSGGDLTGMIDSTDLLRNAYKHGGQLDSAYHYFELKPAYADSMKNATDLNKLQNMAFEQELKDREDAKLKEEAKAERSRNIQYGIIALVVITLLIFLLMLSRSSVVGARAVKNLSLVACCLCSNSSTYCFIPYCTASPTILRC